MPNGIRPHLFLLTSDAIARKVTIERQGYKALIHDTDELNRIGMPEGWEA